MVSLLLSDLVTFCVLSRVASQLKIEITGMLFLPGDCVLSKTFIPSLPPHTWFRSPGQRRSQSSSLMIDDDKGAVSKQKQIELRTPA